MSPISSDRRVPWIRRDRMSRPTGSVPRINVAVPPSCHTGGAKVKSRYCSFGGYGAMTSAPAPNTISMRIKASPMRAPRLCEYASHSSRSGPGVATGAVSSSSVVSSMADSRIDDAVQQIDNEVHTDDDGRDQQNAALHYRVVARLHT